MPQQDDLASIASQFLDLWQDQLSAWAADPAVADAWRRLLTANGSASDGPPGLSSMVPAAMILAWSQALVGGRELDDRGNSGGTAKSTGTATASASPGNGEPKPDELLRRIDALEQRLADLESRSGGTGSGA